MPRIISKKWSWRNGKWGDLARDGTWARHFVTWQAGKIRINSWSEISGWLKFDVLKTAFSIEKFLIFLLINLFKQWLEI
ncbi:hypothetical protein QS306_14835 [Paraburkholderia bonniea]|uniref:hypothetical protein n=1 Tax=Paraburkholderia bonniea TaxID=2152891 RepID=UPI0025725979|nr:hypothetical protein [Paraburkholderia bonniea]WJF92038.1 hypothetical protein QS306_14835 [Paraburkholderia bonniea]WJF95358.1 hypothetical protein QS308_14840 [Paraburkholderia bonniea]